MDSQFVTMEASLNEVGIILTTTSNNEHVSEMERMIRVLKERVRGGYNTLKFKKMPGRLVVELVYWDTFWLNALYPSPSVLPNQSPRTVVTGRTTDFNLHCRYEFGEYVQTHEEHDNSMRTRTVGALALCPTGNEQGGIICKPCYWAATEQTSRHQKIHT